MAARRALTGTGSTPGRAERWSDAWLGAVFARPRWVLVLVAVVTLALAAGLGRLEVRMDGRSLVPADDPALALDREIRDTFGLRDPLVVLLETDRRDGLYDPDVLRRLEAITEAARQLPGVEDVHVTSLATERRDRLYPGTLRFRPFLDPLPTTPALRDALAADLDATRILDGTLVSADRSALAVLVGVPAVEELDGDRAPFYRRLAAVARQHESAEVRVSVLGAPAAEALLGHHVLQDLGRLLPLVLVTMMLVLWWRLRRVSAVLLGMVEVGSCLVATFGLMGWAGVPLTLPTSVLPVVLLSLGLADEVHLLGHYRLLAALHPERDRRSLIRGTYADMLPPVFLTTVTTSLGLGSFVASPIEPIRQFGLFAAAGIFFCFVFSTTVVPAVMVLAPVGRLAAPLADPAPERSPGRWTSRWLGRPLVTLGALGAVAVVLGLGVGRLTVQDGWVDGFAPESEFRRDTDRANALLHGTHSLLVRVEVEGPPGASPPEGDGREGWLLSPDLLREIERLEDHLRGLDGVGGVLGPAGHISTVAHLWQGRTPGTDAIPADAVAVGRVLRYFDLVRGAHRRREVIDDDLDQAVITVFLKNANYRQTEALLAEIRSWETRSTDHRLRLSVGGDVAVSQAMIPAIVSSQVASLLFALLGAATVLLVLRRSVTGMLLTMAPTLLAVTSVFGWMGWAGIPLGVATSMFCAITLGVGIDYGIHLTAAHRRVQRRGVSSAAAAALGEAGSPITTDAIAIAAAFGWLTLSQVPANARLGLLVALALGLSWSWTLFGLGAYWSWREGRRPVAGDDRTAASDVALVTGRPPNRRR